MYQIQDKNNRYLKISIDNKISFTNNESLADVFPSEREATDFIRKAFKKKTRKNYKAVRCDNDFVSDLQSYQSSENEKIADRYIKSIEGFENVISTYLDPEIERYTQELQKFDGMILDIRHWLRDENTKLNACQACKFTLQLQKLERDREACKKELQRLAMLRSDMYKSFKEAKNFEYDDYKSRQIEDVAGYLFTA